ncbi:MAG: hypothetical protein ACRCVI_00835 [Mycoplasmoidaceae bacterium]
MLKIYKYKVQLTKLNYKTYNLNFFCEETNHSCDSKITILEKHKGIKIGKICEELFNLNHVIWSIDSNNKSFPYEYSQPDLMLEYELHNLKK